MRFKKDDDGKLVLDDEGNPIAIDGDGNAIPLDKVVSLGKHQRIEGERDEYKQQAEDLRKQIDDLKQSSGDAAALKKQLDDLTENADKTKSDFETRMAARDKEHALETALLKSGCRDTKAARAHVDFDALKLDGESLSGFDVESFKKDRPYLFEAATEVSTAAASRGASGASEDAQMRSIMGLEPTKE